MKFHFNKVILWLKNGKKRELEFLTNKVNVITGDSGTGKTAIFQIIDYCFFASETKISEEDINENVNWYGINFNINGSNFTIARSYFDHETRKVSDQYYFSSIGEIPKVPFDSIEEKELKVVIEQKFSIDSKTVIPYGGKKLKQGNKISLRYFLLFNTQSHNTIMNIESFFDKQTEDKYREALERIFDLATGIETVKNTLIKEQIDKVDKDIKRLEKKRQLQEKDESLYVNEVKILISKAKGLGLLPESTNSFEEDLENLRNAANGVIREIETMEPSQLDLLKRKKMDIQRSIRNLKKYKDEYDQYQKIQGLNADSLKPIGYIIENYEELIGVDFVSKFFSGLKEELAIVKKKIKHNTPLNINIAKELESLQEEYRLIKSEIERFPQNPVIFRRDIEKYVLLGEIKARLASFSMETEAEDYGLLIQKRQEVFDTLQNELINRDEMKEKTIFLLNELVQYYIDQASKKNALGTYNGYYAVFDYKKKLLNLKAPGALSPSSVGSSSNHMFMHLCFFLGLHELMIKRKVPYIPQFLLLDQPSAPYYGEAKKIKRTKDEKVVWEDIVSDDRLKITAAFSLLNAYIEKVNTVLEEDFQIIVLEHIPEEIWVDNHMKYVHLVEEFRIGGNALINKV